MAKMKVSDLAKGLNISNKELISFLNMNGFEEVKSPNKLIEDDAIALIMRSFASKMKGGQSAKKEAEAPAKKPSAKKTAAAAEKPKAEVSPAKEEGKKEETKEPESRKEAKPENAEGKKSEEKAENSVGEKKEEKKNAGSGQPKNNQNRSGDRSNTGRGEKNRENRDNRESRGDKSGQSRGEKNNQNRDNRGERNQNRDRDNRGDKNGQGRGERNNQNRDNRGERNQNRDRDNRGDRSQSRDGRNDRGQRNNQNKNGDRRSGGNYGGGLGGFAASPIPTKDSNNRNNGYNKKKNNNQRDDDERELRGRKKDPNRKGAFQMPKPVPKPQEPEETIKTITIPEKLTLKELADKMKQQPAALIKKLFLQGKVISINQEITFEEAEEIALEYNCIAELEEKVDIVAELLKEKEEDPATLKKRPPVVCVMGHVDHGKTSLLDAIRETNVTSHEAGGITQHIGAYMVDVNGEKITFLDTPGHEAFTSMRMRGANSTDIAILVVAADDGVMPQTVEAINHAKAAGIEIIVAINKIDKPSANIERVKQELVEYELIAEDWGGTTVFVPVSAHTKEGIDNLLEMILLTADVCELKANPDRKARGIVIEARLDKGRGPVATVLVQKGTLRAGDSIVIGSAFGHIRAMTNDRGQRIKEALPSTPVEIIGLNEVPAAGEIFMVTENEKEARSIASAYITQSKEKLIDDTRAKLSLDGLFSQIQAGNIKELNLIVKADVQGSVEAVKQSLLKLSNEEVAVRVIHGGVGNINESDVSLASASNAIIIGFNVKPESTAKDIADREKVDLRLYRVIYNAIEDVESAMKGMLDPVYEEKVLGHAEVRQTFKASGVGLIAGSYVLDGKIVRGSKARISRGGEQLFDGALASLKRFKDDVKEVAAGYECGLVFEGFNDIQVEDQIEIYIMEEVPR